MKNASKNIFIGVAWPYANGSLHLGHAAGLIGGDILARYYRQKGKNVLFVSGSDCHGTPIVVEAGKQGVKPEKIAKKYHEEFKKTLINGLSFSYDFYSKTTSKTHSKVTQDIFLNLYKKGYIYKKTQRLPYCRKCQKFLPDRYIEGRCPYCGFLNARGDQCDECGKLLDPKNLKNPHCKFCGAKPVWKDSEHFFLNIPAFSSQLEKWIKTHDDWRGNAKKFSLTFLKKIESRAITRDIAWGVKIPIAGYKTKRIYVWFEAVCGYLSASIEWAEKRKNPKMWKNFWIKKECKHYYVHGKDNILFHTIIWPSILLGYGNLKLPDQIVSSEYLTLSGKQFSKSRKWAVWLPVFLKNFDSDPLRYYLTINGPETADTDFSWKQFQLRNNSELVGNFGNFAHRVLSFTHRKLKGKIPKVCFYPKEKKLLEKTKTTFNEAGTLIEEAKFRQAIKTILALAEEGNRFIDHKAPWSNIAKNKTEAESALGVCIQLVNNLRVLIQPFLPKTSEKLGSILKTNNVKWEFQPSIENKTFKKPSPLFKKIENAAIEKEIRHLTG